MRQPPRQHSKPSARLRLPEHQAEPGTSSSSKGRWRSRHRTADREVPVTESLDRRVEPHPDHRALRMSVGHGHVEPDGPRHLPRVKTLRDAVRRCRRRRHPAEVLVGCDLGAAARSVHIDHLDGPDDGPGALFGDSNPATDVGRGGAKLLRLGPVDEHLGPRFGDDEETVDQRGGRHRSPFNHSEAASRWRLGA